jgi:hypothetical protein
MQPGIYNFGDDSPQTNNIVEDGVILNKGKRSPQKGNKVINSTETSTVPDKKDFLLKKLLQFLINNAGKIIIGVIVTVIGGLILAYGFGIGL